MSPVCSCHSAAQPTLFPSAASPRSGSERVAVRGPGGYPVPGMLSLHYACVGCLFRVARALLCSFVKQDCSWCDVVLARGVSVQPRRPGMACLGRASLLLPSPPRSPAARLSHPSPSGKWCVFVALVVSRGFYRMCAVCNRVLLLLIEFCGYFHNVSRQTLGSMNTSPSQVCVLPLA